MCTENKICVLHIKYVSILSTTLLKASSAPINIQHVTPDKHALMHAQQLCQILS
jgi:hypothetical protein